MKKILFIIGLLFIFPLNSLAYNIDTSQMTSDIAKLLEELEQDWPSGLDDGRIEVVRQAGMMIGKGTIYVYGGGHTGQCDTGVPYSLDCSAYVSLAFHRAMVNDVACGWTTESFNTSNDFYDISENDLRPGDVGLNDSGNGVHIGIYVGKKDGNNIWFHSSKNSSVSGPQVRVGNVNFKHFRSYAHWNEVHVSSSSTTNSGIGGELGGKLKDDYPNISSLQTSNDFNCETIFYNVSNGVSEESTLKKILNGIFAIIKVSAPVIAIALSILDYIKVLMGNSSDSFRKANIRTIKRIVIAILVFFVPYILELLFNFFGLYDLSNCGIY